MVARPVRPRAAGCANGAALPCWRGFTDTTLPHTGDAATFDIAHHMEAFAYFA